MHLEVLKGVYIYNSAQEVWIRIPNLKREKLMNTTEGEIFVPLNKSGSPPPPRLGPGGELSRERRAQMIIQLKALMASWYRTAYSPQGSFAFRILASITDAGRHGFCFIKQGAVTARVSVAARGPPAPAPLRLPRWSAPPPLPKSSPGTTVNLRNSAAPNRSGPPFPAWL